MSTASVATYPLTRSPQMMSSAHRQSQANIPSTSTSSSASFGGVHRQPTLKAKLAYIPVLEVPCRKVTLHDGDHEPECPEVHIPASFSMGDPTSSSSSSTSSSSSSCENTAPYSKYEYDSYFQLPSASNISHARLASSTSGISNTPGSLTFNVHLRAVHDQDPFLLPPSPLDLPPSSIGTAIPNWVGGENGKSKLSGRLRRK